jgi:hypothetical protein
MNTMNRNLGWILLLALGVMAGGCGKIGPITGAANPPLTGGNADLTTYVALGTSISAGYQSGGLTVAHQSRAFPSLFARQIGQATFTIPSVSADGLQPLLRIAGVTPTGSVIINNTGRTPGAPTNFAQPSAYHNLGVPGAVLFDVADSTRYHDVSTPAAAGQAAVFGLIQRSRGLLLTQAISKAPTFVSFEFGANEMLGAATQGSGTPIFTPAQFNALYVGTLSALLAARPTCKLALFTVPDVTAAPFFTTFKPLTTDANGQPVALLGPSGPLAPDDMVLLTASNALAVGNGFPVGTVSYLTGAPGTGVPLTNALVLSASEAASIKTATDQYNATILAQAQARGAAWVDMRGLLNQVAANGYPFQTGVITTDFVTGGFFSLDGVHPTDLAHAVLCNLMIQAVNSTFSATIPLVDLNTAATNTSSSARPAPGEGPVLPWIQNAEELYSSMFPWR